MRTCLDSKVRPVA